MMFSLFFKNRKLLILASLLVFLSGGLLVMALLAPSRPQLENVPKREVSQTPAPRAVFVPREIIIGQTTDNEISKLANLKRVVPSSEKTEYFFSSERALRDDLIVTQKGQAIYERKVVDSQDPNQPSLADFLGRFGQADAIKTGSYHYGDSEQTFIFGQQGVAVVYDPFTDHVDEVIHFLPMSTEQFLSSWGQDTYKNIPPSYGD